MSETLRAALATMLRAEMAPVIRALGARPNDAAWEKWADAMLATPAGQALAALVKAAEAWHEGECREAEDADHLRLHAAVDELREAVAWG